MAEQTIATSTTKWAREYETIYILRPTVSTEAAARVAERVQEVMDKGGAKLIKVETWGVRRLAYTIAKNKRGVFVYVRFAAHGDVPAELERNLRLAEPVIRYQTIVIGDMVDLEQVSADADDTTFDAIEGIEEEEELTTAQQLGMEERRSASSDEVSDAAAADDAEDRGDDDDDDEEE